MAPGVAQGTAYKAVGGNLGLEVGQGALPEATEGVVVGWTVSREDSCALETVW